MDDEHYPASGFDLTPGGAVVATVVLFVVFSLAFSLFYDVDYRAWCACMRR